jgi:hypothetical protein
MCKAHIVAQHFIRKVRFRLSEGQSPERSHIQLNPAAANANIAHHVTVQVITNKACTTRVLHHSHLIGFSSLLMISIC